MLKKSLCCLLAFVFVGAFLTGCGDRLDTKRIAEDEKNGIVFKAVKIESRKDAQNAPTPITTYSLFCDGKYVTNEQMNDKKFLKLVNG